MRTRLTLLSAGALTRDVEVRAPAGTPLSLIRAAIHAQTGPFEPLDTTMWSGSRTLPDTAQLGGPGLRSGSVIGVGGPGPRRPETTSVVRLHVVCGPDAGLQIGLPRGLVTVGRDPDCDLRLTDSDVSRQHLELTISTRGVSVRDLSSTNGAHLLSDDGSTAEAIDADGRDLPLERYVRLGETVICVAAVSVPAAATFLHDDGGLIVNRPPRLTHDLRARHVTFDPAGRLNDRAGLPWIAALLPALAGVGLAWFMHNPQFLAFALLSPLLMISTGISDRLTGRRGRKKERVKARHRESAHHKDVLEFAREETTFRRHAHPDPVALMHTAVTPDARIWERRRSDSDFLSVRVGLVDRGADLVVRRGAESVESPTLSAVPLVADLRAGPLGICGPRQLTLACARWALGQIATQHSPNDLSIVAIVGADDANTWSWLRWLPHHGSANPDTDGGRPMIAHTAEQRLSVTTELAAEVAHRSSRGRPDRRWDGPWIVVLLDRAAQHAALPGIGRLLDQGATVGITALCIDDERRRLPPACTSIAEIAGEAGTRIRLRAAAGEDSLALTERVSRSWADRLSRALCPLRDPADEAASVLPRAIRLLDLIDGGLDPAAVNRRWTETGRHGGARSILGLAADGPFEIDLERDGPHALVAGTTGAGKSELLQSLVAGLALNCAPTDLQFVLIDYKGGAAFADCARLPHTTGLVTDLDGHLTERALRSLGAELTRRESLFSQAGTNDLSAYRRSERHARDPIGRLVLVVDEFAALAEELPDFVTGLIGIAQRGRSLGVHLVLATQRPGGVVSPEIRANTALRIALRVTDPAESGDVIGSDQAASIDKATPGRAIVRIGSALSAVQTARIGGHRAPVRPDVEIIGLDRWGVAADDGVTPPPTGPTDLHELVEALRAGAEEGGFPSLRRPWLDPLPDVVDIDSLPGVDRVAAYRVPLGLVDRPDEQVQEADCLDLAHGTSLLICGGPRSGRSSALRTIAARAAAQLTPAQLHLHVIDCAGGAMRALAALAHCGSMVARPEPAAIDRLLVRMTEEVSRRHSVLAQLGVGTAAEARGRGVDLPALVLVIDGWEGFLAVAEEIDSGRPVDTVLDLLRDATSTGLTILIAGDRATLATRLSSAMQLRLILRMSDPDDYVMAGISKRQIPGRMPPGRALDPADGTERQLAVFGPDPGTAAQLSHIERLAPAGGDIVDPTVLPFRIRALPTRIQLSDLKTPGDLRKVRDRDRSNDLEPVFPPLGCVRLGAGGDDASALTVAAAGVEARFLIAGPPRSGRSTALITIATQLAPPPYPASPYPASPEVKDPPWTLIVAAGLRSPLYRWAESAGIATLAPSGLSTGSTGATGPTGPTGAGRTARLSALEELGTGDTPRVLLIDDCDQFNDTAVGEQLAVLIRSSPIGLSVFAAGRSDELAVTYRGIGVEVRRARTGLLLQPGPGDGDLFGIRLPFSRTTVPPGRGYLIADELLRPPPRISGPAIAIQVALA